MGTYIFFSLTLRKFDPTKSSKFIDFTPVPHRQHSINTSHLHPPNVYSLHPNLQLLTILVLESKSAHRASFLTMCTRHPSWFLSSNVYLMTIIFFSLLQFLTEPIWIHMLNNQSSLEKTSKLWTQIQVNYLTLIWHEINKILKNVCEKEVQYTSSWIYNHSNLIKYESNKESLVRMEFLESGLMYFLKATLILYSYIDFIISKIPHFKNSKIHTENWSLFFPNKKASYPMEWASKWRNERVIIVQLSTLNTE